MSDELHKYPGNLKHHKVDAPARREPLLSDGGISDMWYFGDPNDVKNLDVPIKDAVPDDYYEWGAKDVRDFYEAARAKDAELIQRLVDAALYIYWTKPEAAKARMNEVLKAAAAAGFKPSE